MTLLELYQLWKADGEKGALSRELLEQAHWFAAHAEFDPKTGDALPQSLSSFLIKLTEVGPIGSIQDRLFRIVEHVRPALERLICGPNESPRREHAVLPLRAVRELDAGSFIKLSMRPGRTVREKLAGKPYLTAVRRFQSVDLPENRLLKAFVSRLAELLELRQIYLGEPEDELLPRIRSWLISDEGKSIGQWHNPPPNNTLLAHRDYRRVWDAWRRLQTLDADIDRDLRHLEQRRETVRRWTEYARMYREGGWLFAEMPVLFDYDNFTVQPWVSKPVIQQSTSKIVRGVGYREVTGPACIDLVEVCPRFADSAEGSLSLDETYLWQQWKNDNHTVDIALFRSDALFLHEDACTVALTDLFFDSDTPPELLDRAARAFAGRLRQTFKSGKLIWLFPDSVNDFELEILRRNLNACFPDAEPLPRSVAALFEEVNYTRIGSEGYPIAVVDSVGGMTCVTKFLAKFDQELKSRVPETRGFYWERCPPVICSQPDAAQATKREQHYELFTVDTDGNWHSLVRPKQPKSMEVYAFKNDSRIGKIAWWIQVTQSPVAGGMRFQALQARAGDIPLWRDQIPELSIRVLKAGRYQSFYLVPRGTTVTPIRGSSVQIPVRGRFTLPARKRFYQFPLYQGENANQLRFSARLDSPAFPLTKSTECELILTFRYGEDDPYTLLFIPLDKSFPPVRATWQRTAEEVVTDAPAPGYPEPMSWRDLRSVPKPGSQETSDLLEWFLSAMEGLDRDLFIRPLPRTRGKLITEWRQDRNGQYFSFARCPEADLDVFIHQRNFVDGVNFQDFQVGHRLSFELNVEDGRCWGSRIAGPNYKATTRLHSLDEQTTKKVCENIRRRLYFPVISIWKDGRSLTDRGCPKAFARAATEKIVYLSDLVARKEVPQAVKNELLFLLACLHKDTTETCVQWIIKQVENRKIDYPKAVGFSLGDLSKEWQLSIFRKLASDPDSRAITVFAYSIWREQHFVEHFTREELESLLPILLDLIKKLVPHGKDGRKLIMAAPLELLLGLLRTRASDDPCIKMLLQPHQKITKQFAEQIDRIEDIIAGSGVTLFSRVQINLPKPEDVTTPDLLYALRLYLTGDDAANAIHITDVSDTDDN